MSAGDGAVVRSGEVGGAGDCVGAEMSNDFLPTVPMGITIGELFREEAEAAGKPIPTDEEIGDILWSQTGWPAFWNIPSDGATPVECLRKQVREFFKHGWRDPYEGFVSSNQDDDSP